MYGYMAKTRIEQKIDIPDSLFKELLTSSELRMVKQRLFIIKCLLDGLSIRAIAKEAKVGTDTVVRVTKMMNANKKIKDFFKKDQSVKLSKWVFGESVETSRNQ